MSAMKTPLVTATVLGSVLLASCAPQQEPSTSSSADNKAAAPPAARSAPQRSKQPDPADGIGTKLCISKCINERNAPCDATCGGNNTPSDGGSCASCCRDYCVRNIASASASLAKREESGQEPPAGMTRVSDFNGVLVGTRGQEHNYSLKKGHNAIKVQTLGSGRLICAVRVGNEYVARSEGDGHCELAFDAIADVEVFLVIQSMDGASHSYKGTVFYGR